MQNQILGEYPCKVDAKGRVRLPSALLKQLEDFGAHKFVVNRGFKKYLVLYPEKVWGEVTEEIEKLNQFVEKNRIFKRLFLRGSTPMTLGGSDRINFPQSLLDYANIKNEVVLAGSGDRVEIWDAETYYAMMDEDIDLSALAEDVLGGFSGGGMPAAS